MGEGGTVGNQVLAVLADEEHLAGLQVLGQGGNEGAPRFLTQAKGPGDRLRHERGVRDRRELFLYVRG